jgi:alcohol dehydrogenase (cytochrome c)
MTLSQVKSSLIGRRLAIAAGALLFLACLLLNWKIAGAQEPAAASIEHADKEPQNWLTFFGNYQAWSYTPLDQIKRENVKRLAPAWAFATGSHFGLQSAPLEADGVLYLADPEDNIFAVDAVTGKPLWKYTYKRPEGKPARAGNRAAGIALGYGMVFEGTSDDRLVAVNAKTGQEAWNIEVEDPEKCGCGINSAPLIVKDKVITGGTGGERAHRGYLSAYDAKTGKLDWRFYTIPAPGEPGSETWSGDSWKLGGGTTWFTGSYDPQLNLIYWGIGNPSSDFYGEDRQGANLYTNSLIALDADTGKLKWYYQEIPHDLNDYDADPEPVLVDVALNGQMRKLVIHSNKSGYAYVLDRETGKFIRAFPYVDTITWAKGLDEKGQPVMTVPPVDGSQYLYCPGALGGHNRNHSAYSPRTGLWYSSAFETCATIKPVKMTVKEGDGYFGGTMEEAPNSKTKPFIAAFDPATGKRAWTFSTNYVNTSSLLATAGDLIFGGDIQGSAFALDARTGKQLWSFNTGGRISAPVVSYSVGGRQYVAVPTGGGAIAENALRNYFTEAHVQLPEVTSTLFVFALPEAP